MDEQKLYEVQKGSEEWSFVETMFWAEPKETTVYGVQGKWDEVWRPHLVLCMAWKLWAEAVAEREKGGEPGAMRRLRQAVGWLKELCG